MTEDQVNQLIESMNRIAGALEKVADAIANDEPLNYSIGRSLDKIAESLNSNGSGLDSIANAICCGDKQF
jgi:hypothetical protein